MRRVLNQIKRYLTFSRADRNAIIILCFLILISITAIFILNTYQPKSTSDFSDIKKLLDEWEKSQESKSRPSKTSLFHFNPNEITLAELDSLALPKFIKRNIISYREAGGRFKSVDDVRKIYGMTDSIFLQVKDYIIIPEEKVVKLASKESLPKKLDGFFDPNTTSEMELKRFGFDDFQISNLISYRNKGGKFVFEEDILKIYGVDSTLYNRIEKHIKINIVDNPIQKKEELAEMVELNGADSIKLVGLHGIGPSFAKRIIKYRDLLGGFHAKSQLLEVYNFPEETFLQIKDQVETDTLKIEKIRINFAEYRDLLRHPYLQKNQVEAILKKRETDGSFKKISELQEISAIDKNTYKKIRPYITCH